MIPNLKQLGNKNKGSLYLLRANRLGGSSATPLFSFLKSPPPYSRNERISKKEGCLTKGGQTGSAPRTFFASNGVKFLPFYRLRTASVVGNKNISTVPLNFSKIKPYPKKIQTKNYRDISVVFLLFGGEGGI